MLQGRQGFEESRVLVLPAQQVHHVLRGSLLRPRTRSSLPAAQTRAVATIVLPNHQPRITLSAEPVTFPRAGGFRPIRGVGGFTQQVSRNW